MANHEHSMHTHGTEPEPAVAASPLRRGRWVFWIFAILALAYLLAEHRAHFLRALPFLIILACPLLHMFMHGGHGGHGGHAAASPDRKE